MSKSWILLVGVSLMVILSGCSVDNSTAIGGTLKKAQIYKNRAAEYAKSAPAAPYSPVAELVDLKELVADQGLLLGVDQLALIGGAAKKVGVDQATLATIVESELRGLDPGELDRDVVSALAGENSSIGIAQVLVSTAVEIEQEDSTGLMPEYSGGDLARTERIRRLAADDWSILYAASYLKLLGQRFQGEDGLSMANRYTGRSPKSFSADKKALFDMFESSYH